MFDPTASPPTLHDLYGDAAVPCRALPHDLAAEQDGFYRNAPPESDDELDRLWAEEQERRDATRPAA